MNASVNESMRSGWCSGEMRDTAQLGSLPAIMVERVMPRTTRSRLFRTWGSLIGMLPVGGPNIWGNGTWAPDDTPAMRAANESHGCVSKLLCCCKPCSWTAQAFVFLFSESGA